MRKDEVGMQEEHHVLGPEAMRAEVNWQERVPQTHRRAGSVMSEMMNVTHGMKDIKVCNMCLLWFVFFEW